MLFSWKYFDNISDIAQKCMDIHYKLHSCELSIFLHVCDGWSVYVVLGEGVKRPREGCGIPPPTVYRTQPQKLEYKIAFRAIETMF